MSKLHKYLTIPCIVLALVTVSALVTASAPGQPPPLAAATFVTLSALQRPPRALETHILRERQVDLDLKALGGSGSAYPRLLRLEFFPDVSYTAALNRITVTASGVTWSGYLRGVPLSTAVFARVGRAVAGVVASPLGHFALESDGAGSYTVRQIDRSPRGQQTHNDVIVPPSGPGAGVDIPGRAFSSAPASDSVVDALVAYTPSAGAGQPGGIDTLKAKTHVMIGLADTALRAAGTGGVRLAGTLEIELAADEDDIRAALRQLTDDEAVQAARDQLAADVVTLILNEATDPGAVGLLLTPDVPSPESTAFSVVSRPRMLGRNFAHELGHNMGLSHDWYEDGPGAWLPSAHGLVSLEGRFITLMAYNTKCIDVLGLPCSTWLPIFSDPNSTHMGFPTGVAIGTNLNCTIGNVDNPPCDTDAVSTLAETAPIVAGYRHHSNRLDTGQSLGAGQFLRPRAAPGAACSLLYKNDGDLVAAYTDGTQYWASGTSGSSAGSVVMQTDGNLIVYDDVGTPVWASGTSGHPGASLAIQRDCNVVVRATDGTSLWASGLSVPPPPTFPVDPVIYEFSADPTTIKLGEWSVLRFETYSGIASSLWITDPDGSRHARWEDSEIPSSAGFTHGNGYSGTGTHSLTFEVTGPEGTTPATETLEITVTAP